MKLSLVTPFAISSIQRVVISKPLSVDAVDKTAGAAAVRDARMPKPVIVENRIAMVFRLNLGSARCRKVQRVSVGQSDASLWVTISVFWLQYGEVNESYARLMQKPLRHKLARKER